jgi:Fe-S-cluster containining protein
MEHLNGTDPEVERLERQVERGSLFTHTALSNNADRINEAEAFLFGLIDLLIDRGVITQEDVTEKTEAVRQEMVERGETLGPGVVMRVDNENRKGFIPVNCDERIHICQAVCCKLSFPLNAEEIESGELKWDLGKPYHIRHETDGYCTHQNRETRGCGVYDHRPSVCKGYSCAKDDRIWSDFDNMILNEEWISQNLRQDRPRLARIAMVRVEDITNRPPDAAEVEAE